MTSLAAPSKQPSIFARKQSTWVDSVLLQDVKQDYNGALTQRFLSNVDSYSSRAMKVNETAPNQQSSISPAALLPKAQLNERRKSSDAT